MTTCVRLTSVEQRLRLSYDTTLVLPRTPVSPDEFFVADDAGPRVGVHRASCCGKKFSEHAVFERRQHVPFFKRGWVRLNVRSSSPVAAHCWHRTAIQVLLIS